MLKSFFSRRRIVRFISLSIALLTVTVMLCSNVSAESSVDTIDNGFTYWEGFSSKTAVDTKSMFEPIKKISGLDVGNSDFGSLNYICSYNSMLYVMDAENGCIYVLNRNLELIKTITSVNNNGEILEFKGAEGLFVDKDGIYIADTSNERILCCNAENDVYKIITRPESSAMPDTLVFAPTRVVRDQSGYIYTLCKGSYYGLVVFSDEYEFLGFYGANNVKSSFTDAIKSLITSLFETEAKHDSSTQALPFQMTDVCIDSEGFICTVNGESSGQIKRFGPAGTNILVHTNQFESENGDSFDFGDNPRSYVDVYSKYGVAISQNMSMITSDSDGFYYIADSSRGKIFVYDKNCQLLNTFGGGASKGEQFGYFVTPISIAILDDQLVVADYGTKKLTLFELSDYGNNLKTASIFTNESQYLKAKPYWNAVLREDKNNQLAYKGLARAALEEQDYSLAKKLSKAGIDRVTYAHAYKAEQELFLQKNFWWIAILVCAAVGVGLRLMFLSKKRRIVFIKNENLSVAFNTMIHPFDSFRRIKQGNNSILIATLFMVAYYVTMVASKLYGGFMYDSVDISSFNAIYTLIGSAGIVLLWVVANWLICVLFDGKGKLKDIYCATCYSLMPMILYYLIYLVFSHTVVPSTNDVFGIIKLICSVVFGLLILLSVTVIHDFDFFKAIGTSLLAVIGMCIVAFVLFLILTLFQDLLGFIISVINEITLR